MKRSRPGRPGRRGRRGRFIVILGGTRSGKSLIGLWLGEQVAGPRLFVATGAAADADDPEMRARVRRHRRGRTGRWRTVEAPLALCKTLDGLNGRYRVVLLDCVTRWVANLTAAGLSDAAIHREAGRLVRTIQTVAATVIVVVDEVGWGIVPASPLGRRFRDLAGLVNQRLTKAADEVYAVMAGVPMRVK